MEPKLFSKKVILFFFLIGLCSALLFRLIIFLNYIDTAYSRLAWYLGVVGYLFFFGFRFYISLKRRNVIIKNELISKIKNSNLDQASVKDVSYILNSITKSKEMFNYIFIFITSGLAIIFDIILTFLK